MARARKAPARPAARPKLRPSVVAPTVGERLRLAEEPHAHIVCRVCGRIQPLGLNELDRHLLTELAGLRPDGWAVERIAFSLTGSCRRCREGSGRP